jgi:3-deoxy-D-manno-octulosonate 8-phosphate phosphatase KdsC-like HAD superfamily phosphatase
VIIITGRKSNIVEKRMSDLGVDLVFKVVKIKVWHLREACAQFNLDLKIVYIWAMIGLIFLHLQLQE